MESSWLVLLSTVDSWQILAITAKVMTYASCMAAGGGVFFLAVFHAQLDRYFLREIGRVLLFTSVVGIAFSVVRLGVMNGMMSDNWVGVFSVEMTRMILVSSEGAAFTMRLVGLALIGVYFSRNVRLRFIAIPFIGAIVTVVSFGVPGHTIDLAQKLGILTRVLISLHLLSVAFWLGALWPLYRLTFCEDIGVVTSIIRQFGRIAPIAVGILVAAGTVLLWGMLGNAEALWLSNYGQAMMAKLLGVFCLISLATANKLRLVPGLAVGDRASVVRLRRSVGIEMIVAAMILLITAGITSAIGPPAIN